MKSDESGEFYYPSKLLLEYGANQTEHHQSILEKTKKALKKIAGESRINKIRISDWLKVEVDQ